MAQPGRTQRSPAAFLPASAQTQASPSASSDADQQRLPPIFFPIEQLMDSSDLKWNPRCVCTQVLRTQSQTQMVSGPDRLRHHSYTLTVSVYQTK